MLATPRRIGLLAGIVAVTAIVATGAAVLWSASTTTTGAPGVELRRGAVAPDFELADVNTGQPVRLSALRGRPVWINFWATWCPPCKEELPRIKQVYDKYKGKGLAIVGVDMREDPTLIKSFTKQNGYDWTFVVDKDGAVTNHFFTAGIPNHVFIDAAGVVQAVHIGDLQQSMMEELVGKIVTSTAQSALTLR